MTAQTRRALDRVRKSALRTVESVDKLKPADWAALTFVDRMELRAARVLCRWIAKNLPEYAAPVAVPAGTLMVGSFTGAALTNTTVPTLAEVGDYRADDQADEARDVARELAAREEAS